MSPFLRARPRRNRKSEVVRSFHRETHLGPDESDPFTVLGVAHDAEFGVIRAAYRRLMADHHPDRVIQMGAPREFEDAAHAKAAAITAAYAQIRTERGLLIRQDS